MPTERRLIRALAAGGVAVHRETGFAVFRSMDARRSSIGHLSQTTLLNLAGQGLIRLVDDKWCWAGGAVGGFDDDAPDTIPAISPQPMARAGKRNEIVLVRALAQARDPQHALRLAGAARRYLLDLAACDAGQTVTMNWSFVPKGRTGGHGHGCALDARRADQRIRDALGYREGDFLNAALSERASVRRLALDFDCPSGTIIRRVHDVLTRVADLYDVAIAPADD